MEEAAPEVAVVFFLLRQVEEMQPRQVGGGILRLSGCFKKKHHGTLEQPEMAPP